MAMSRMDASECGMPSWELTMQANAQVKVNFLQLEVESGILFADLALSAPDTFRRIRNAKKAKIAYITVFRFVDRVVVFDLRGIAARLELLNQKLVALGETSEEVFGRRLDDRIRRLAAIAENSPHDSVFRRQITEQIKAEMEQYFEREKNPNYKSDRRSEKPNFETF